MRTVKTWNFIHSLKGFEIELNERSYWGNLLADALESLDAGWWGKYRNLPFCWINPWGWTWRIGTEDHNLGSFWFDMGQKYLNWADSFRKEKSLKRFHLSDEEVKENFPETWEWHNFWGEDDE